MSYNERPDDLEYFDGQNAYSLKRKGNVTTFHKHITTASGTSDEDDIVFWLHINAPTAMFLHFANRGAAPTSATAQTYSPFFYKLDGIVEDVDLATAKIYDTNAWHDNILTKTGTPSDLENPGVANAIVGGREHFWWYVDHSRFKWSRGVPGNNNSSYPDPEDQGFVRSDGFNVWYPPYFWLQIAIEKLEHTLPSEFTLTLTCRYD